MKLLGGASLVICMALMAGCGQSNQATVCANRLVGTGVGVSYAGFAKGTVLTVQVCVTGKCYVGAPTATDSSALVGAGIASIPLNGVQFISVTVRDTSTRIVAREESVAVRRLAVQDGCDRIEFSAALRVSPGHVTAATHS